uniref:Ketoreductase (KR) domain-containing protein n=1 Tax=Micromonas pusilla TaxID=38833 RepID=A0A7S0ILR8_MICPS|mmetsp:Transcript_9201/g.37628  ORF Transcript_9201/g.37628 Transcript_9201/m.37628 type:complete len:564 (+) Transcript_9201:60-1751(+)
MSCEVPVTCRTVLGQSLGWGGFGGGDDPLRNPASGSFDRASTAADVTRGLDLRGRCYVLTGATGALGREVARALVRVGAHVIIAARSMARGSALAEELRRDGAGAGAGAATTVDRVNDAPSSPHRSPSSPRAPNDDDAKSAAPKSPGDATVMLCDLASQDSVRSFARSFRRKALPLHGVLNCAAVILRPFELTPEGRESHFAVNHLGHFLLVNELLPELVATASVSGIQARVVNVTSAMHHFTYRVRRGRAGPSRGIDFTQLDDPRGYDPINAYAQSKLANILHAWQLNERFRQVPRGSVHSVDRRGGGGSFGGAGADAAADDENTAVRPVTAFAVHPGAFGRELRDTLSRNLPFGAGGVLFDVARSISLGLVKTPEQAAATVLYCACLGSGFGFTADGLARSGCYYADCAATKCSLPARDPRLARALWETSERLCGMAPGGALPRVDGGGGGETYGGFSAVGGSRFPGGDVVGAISPPPRGVSMSAFASASAKNGERRRRTRGESPGGESPGNEERMARVGEGVSLAKAVDDAGSPPTSSQSGSDPPRKATPSKSGRWGLGA